MKLLVASIIFAIPLTSNAVYKCTDSNGKSTYSQIPCASNAEKLNVEESEFRKQQIETNIAVKKLVADAQQREFEEKQKEAERIWRENEQLRLQREIILRQNAIANETQKIKQQLNEPKVTICDKLPNGGSICF
jgi:hypothetical protein